jgi:hypothetical protein
MKTAQRKLTKKTRIQKRDKALIDQLDDSPLSPDFSKLTKPEPANVGPVLRWKSAQTPS